MDCEARETKGHPHGSWNYRGGGQCSWWTESLVLQVGVTWKRSDQDGGQQAGAGGQADNMHIKTAGV